LLAYIATLFIVKLSWRDAAVGLLVPQLSWSRDCLMTIVAIFGTTISPYLFFWQASEEAEDIKTLGERALKAAPDQGPAELRRIGIDTMAGMAASNLVALAILLTTAATLNPAHVTDLQTSAQAAQALRPVAGAYASILFALGIVGTGLLAVPVLAGSAAYAIAEALGWPAGLSRRPRQAKAFYATIAAATLVGTALNFAPVNPIRALFWTAVINGVIAVPVMAIMMLLSQREKVMGEFVLEGPLKCFGWLATALMAAVVLALAVTSF
jgi:Mn2+/Fe2+ NRAMP family transporter